jgi:hypothetical protein
MRTLNTSQKSEVGSRKSRTFRQLRTSAFRIPTSDRRRGTSLSEVLVSTLVMSIGVVALATLFPISVLRSIQASQLTNAALVRYNAESLLRSVPEILNIGTEWQPVTTYAAGDTVVPPVVTRRKTPPAVFVCTAAGTTGGAEPQWNFREGGPTTDGGVTWTTVSFFQRDSRNYVVDPLGFVLIDPADANSAFRGGGVAGAREHFGNVNGNPFKAGLNRFPAFGFYLPGNSPELNEANAASIAILPDSWTLQAESLDVAYTSGNTNIVLNGVNATELASSVQFTTPDLVPDRIVIFDDSNRRSHTFPVIGVSGTPQATQVDWSGMALPNNFQPVKARVESLERRYSQLLSVRRGSSGVSYVDVVVFFRRSYGVQDEQVYSCVFRRIDRGPDGQPGNAGVDDNNNGTNDDVKELGWPGSDDKPRNFCVVQYSSAGQKPFFKKGSFVCDIHNLRWYRVIDVTEDPLPPFNIADVSPEGYEVDPVAPGMDRFVRLTLDQYVLQDSPLDNTLTPVVTSGVVGGAVLMRGVVDVFPLKPRTPWEE